MRPWGRARARAGRPGRSAIALAATAVAGVVGALTTPAAAWATHAARIAEVTTAAGAAGATGVARAAGSTGSATDGQAIFATLEALDRRLADSEASLRAALAQRAALEDGRARCEAALAAQKLRAARLAARARTRLRHLARLPSGARLALLRGTPSHRELRGAVRVLRQVAAQDREHAGQVAATRARLSEVEAALAVRTAAADRAIAQARAARDRIAHDRRARHDLIRLTRLSRGQGRRLGREQRQARARLREIVRAMPADAGRGGFRARRGRLPWPTVGPLRAAFGQRVELAYGTVTRHHGWDIAAAAGSPVQAVAPGRVAYAGWMRGYGRIAIVDHGEGYHVIAAHLADLAVAEGEQVDAGRVLGTVGDSGSTRGTMLYFEIRHHGSPEDPRRWLRR